MHRYWRHCPPQSRHYYELIRESHPCRLYFDLEYHKLFNPHLLTDPNINILLMRQFIQQLVVEIYTRFGIRVSSRDIIDLDSSTEGKFSRHLIVHFPQGELFQNAMECGVFVKHFVGRLVEEVVTGTMGAEYDVLKMALFVNSTISSSTSSISTNSSTSTTNQNKDVQNKTLFIDTGVYTRNRLFRLMGSSKFGKPVSAALRISDSNQFPFPKDFGNEQFFVPVMRNSLSGSGSGRDRRNRNRRNRKGDDGGCENSNGDDNDDNNHDDKGDGSEEDLAYSSDDSGDVSAIILCYQIHCSFETHRSCFSFYCNIIAIQLGKSCSGSRTDVCDTIRVQQCPHSRCKQFEERRRKRQLQLQFQFQSKQ